MRLVKKINYRCAAVVWPGEYTIDRWDNKRCEETNPHDMFKCEYCGEYFCIMLHWTKHNCQEKQ